MATNDPKQILEFAALAISAASGASRHASLDSDTVERILYRLKKIERRLEALAPSPDETISPE